MKTVVIWILVGVLFVVLVLGSMVATTGLDIFGLKLGKYVENARTDVTRQTNQYVTTQQGLLVEYAIDYEAARDDGSTGQMAAILSQMKSIAATLEEDQIPAPAAVILGQSY